MNPLHREIYASDVIDALPAHEVRDHACYRLMARAGDTAAMMKARCVDMLAPDRIM